MTQRMKPEVKALWCAALRSGEFKQGQGQLQKDGCDCCLGVLTELYLRETGVVMNGWETLGELPEEVCTWAGLFIGEDDDNFGSDADPDLGSYTASERNDGSGAQPPQSFSEIADLIEKYL